MSAGAGAMDFYAPEDVRVPNYRTTRVALGLAVELPPGKALLITARSGHGLRYGAGVPHGMVLIDSDYRGEIAMIFIATTPFDIKAGERICQGVVIDAPQYLIAMVNELSPTARGDGGFGSTGN
jgi:dUTP pyrophosphatase